MFEQPWIERNGGHSKIGRWEFLKEVSVKVGAVGLAGSVIGAGVLGAPVEVEESRNGQAAQTMDEALAKDWLSRWEKFILDDARNRYCDREMGEEIGWLISPFLNGFYYGYLATQDAKWANEQMGK